MAIVYLFQALARERERTIIILLSYTLIIRSYQYTYMYACNYITFFSIFLHCISHGQSLKLPYTAHACMPTTIDIITY